MAFYVYRVFDVDARLIYVGCTSNLPGRMRAHELNSWWAPHAKKVVAKVFGDKDSARAAEARAIKTENPRWNVRGRYSSAPGWAWEDFRDYYTAVENASPSTPARATHLKNVALRFFRTFGEELSSAA